MIRFWPKQSNERLVKTITSHSRTMRSSELNSGFSQLEMLMEQRRNVFTCAYDAHVTQVVRKEIIDICLNWSSHTRQLRPRDLHRKPRAKQYRPLNSRDLQCKPRAKQHQPLKSLARLFDCSCSCLKKNYKLYPKCEWYGGTCNERSPPLS